MSAEPQFNLDPNKQQRKEDMKFKGEIYGDHHRSTGMPSTEHLNKFTAEHGIKLNQK